jgi:hypothetical protein
MKPHKIGDLIRFGSPDRRQKFNLNGWIDEYDNLIPCGSLGLIVKKCYKRDEHWTGWEYDILIPALGLVTPNWGNFAFKMLEEDL